MSTIIFYGILTLPLCLSIYVNRYYKNEWSVFFKIVQEFFDEVHSNLELIYEDAAETDYHLSFTEHLE